MNFNPNTNKKYTSRNSRSLSRHAFSNEYPRDSFYTHTPNHQNLIQQAQHNFIPYSQRPERNNRRNYDRDPDHYKHSNYSHPHYVSPAVPAYNTNQVHQYQRSKDSEKQNSPRSNKHSTISTNEKVKQEHKLYACPSCSSQYDCVLRSGRYTGKIPLILNCKHTVCQECIYKSVKSDTIVCPTCCNPSVLSRKHSIDNLQDVFSPNFYVLGRILWCKAKGNDMPNMTLVPADTVDAKKFDFDFKHANTGPTCCFLSCNRIALLRCQDCNDVYCTECCTTVHKSAKSLWSHQQVPLTNNLFSAELERCSEHNMNSEIYCVLCNQEACCYCWIDKHEGHDKDYLHRLSKAKQDELGSLREKAEHNFRRLLHTHKKILSMYNCSTMAAEKKISHYFVNLYSRIQFIEKTLLKEASKFQGVGTSGRGLDKTRTKLQESIQELKQVLTVCESMDDKTLNLKLLYKKLKEFENIPCFLLNGDNEVLEPFKFSVDPMIENLEDCFKVLKSTESEFTLVTENELPADYQIEPISDSDIDSCLSSLASSKKENFKQKRRAEKFLGGDCVKLSSDKELVEVTHIDSLERFYVQQKKVQFRLLQMNKEIDNYIKMAAPVERPQLNELYLALFESKDEKMWCRCRLTEMKNGETEPVYEVFFIDYGRTQTVDISKLREIAPNIAQRKPFAIQCELYNPTYANWDKNAHVYMGKIINGKEIYMLVKNIHNGTYTIDLMVSSSDRGFTSVIDILIHTGRNTLHTSNSDSSLDSTFALKQVSFPSSYTQQHQIFSNNTKFEKGQVEQVIIANVVDPHHIYIHVAAYADALKKMTNEMRLYYRRSATYNSCVPVECTYVVVEHKDSIRGNWHRAYVKQVDIVHETVHVYFVDWGTNITVPFSNIRMLVEQFTRLESQAILIKLVHVEPYQRAHVWSERAILFLNNKFSSQETLKMVVHNLNPLEVALFEMLPTFDVCLNSQLVEHKLADSTGKISQLLEWPQNTCEQKGFNEDDGLLSSILKKAEESADDDNLEDAEDKKLAKQKIQIVKVVSPGLIYIKFNCREEKEFKLYSELQIHYAKERVPKDAWEETERCVTVWQDQYVRGIIIGKVGDDYKVNVVDKVDEIIVPLDKIYVLTGYFQSFSQIVFKSHLANIRPAGGNNWSGSSTETLQILFGTYKDIFATKVTEENSEKSMPLKIWYTQVKVGDALEASITKYVSVNNFLVKLGLAYKKVVSNVKNDELDAKSDSEDKLQMYETSSTTEWNKLVEEEEEEKMRQEQKKADSPYHTRETEIKDWLPPFTLEREQFNAWVLCAEPEGIIFLRDEKLQAIYKEMEANIKEYFDDKARKEEDKNHIWKVGQLCSIAYDKHWYRGKVHQVNSPDDIEVIMIDFGSDHHVASKDLHREILYPKIPAFASKVKLDRVYAKSGKWLTSDYETLLELMTEYSKVVIKGPLDVEIPAAEIYTNSGVNVNNTLVNQCPNLSRSEIDEVSNSDDDIVIEEEEELLKGTPVDTTNFQYRYDPLPKSNTVDMFIMTILSYNKVVLKNSGPDPDPKLPQLQKNIQKYESIQPHIEKIELGMPCIARYSDDNMWYRAQIYNVDGLSGRYVMVYFVDFGNVESVLINDVKMMRPEWFDLPAPCYIATLNFDLIGNHHEYVAQHIRKFFGKNKTIEFVSKIPLLINILDTDKKLAYQSLIQSGFIELTKELKVSPTIENVNGDSSEETNNGPETNNEPAIRNGPETNFNSKIKSDLDLEPKEVNVSI